MVFEYYVFGVELYDSIHTLGPKLSRSRRYRVHGFSPMCDVVHHVRKVRMYGSNKNETAVRGRRAGGAATHKGPNTR